MSDEERRTFNVALLKHLNIEIDILDRALRLASGIISTTEGYTGEHPEDIYQRLYMEAAADKGAKETAVE